MRDTAATGGVAFFCSSPSWGGLEINALRLAGRLRGLGLPVTIIARDGTPLHREAIRAGLPLETAGPHRKYFDFGAARALSAMLGRIGARTLCVFHRDDLDLAAWTKVLGPGGLRLIYHQSMQLGVSRRDPVHAFRYSRYDAWISPLEWLREEALEKTRVPAAKIRVIPLGIETASLAPEDSTGMPSKEEARQRFGVPPGGTLFGVIGRIEPGKGQGFVAKSVKRLRDEGHDARLLVVGDATIEPGAGKHTIDFAEQLRDGVRQLGLSGVAVVHPFVEDVRPFYRAVDVCVMATASETYGMVTLEAMASGTPVIGTDAGGTPEILGGGRYGMLYRPMDRDDFVRAASAFLRGEYPAGMVEAARERALTEFSAARAAAMTADLIRELARGPLGRG